jgi:hypothetical protein
MHLKIGYLHKIKMYSTSMGNLTCIESSYTFSSLTGRQLYLFLPCKVQTNKVKGLIVILSFMGHKNDEKNQLGFRKKSIMELHCIYIIA